VKILVADDSRVMRQIIIRTLRQAGYDGHEIVEAEGGRDALAKAQSEDPDLVMSDWHMPDMTGIECLIALRAAGSAVPFGFITSDVSTDLRREALAAGAAFLIAKPFNAETLRTALEEQPPPVGSASDPGEEGRHEDRDGHAQGSSVPAAKDIRDLLSELLGRPVTVSPGRRVVPTREAPVSLATYVDKARSVSALCLMDVPLSGYTAGALALLPPGGVRDAVEEKEFGSSLVEALHEVANILSKVLNTPGAPRATLHTLYPPGSFLPEELLVSASGFERLDLVVTVPGYGQGAMSLVRAA
jgi:CheY-like chemotaxis protein